MKNSARPESDIFNELVALCLRPGYVHALAYLSFRDNVILYTDELKKPDLEKMFSFSRLIRTEINTLLGLMIKAEIDWVLPTSTTLQQYIDASCWNCIIVCRASSLRDLQRKQ